MALAGLLSALVAGGAAAEVELGQHDVLDTRFGRLQVLGGEVDQQLALGQAPVEGVADARVAILGAWALAGEAWDWALVEVAHMGNMCPGRLVLLRVSGAGLARTSEFAECLGRIEDVAVEPGRITVAVADPAVEVARRLFAFDGATFTETPVPAGITAPAGSGADVLRWEGQHFQAVVEDPGERARFAQIMSPDNLESVRRMSGVGGQGERRGDWIVGRGCQPHQCNAAMALWAIRISDGAPVAALWRSEGPGAVFGDPAVRADPAIAGILHDFTAP
jgi:hypothetical protein